MQINSLILCSLLLICFIFPSKSQLNPVITSYYVTNSVDSDGNPIDIFKVTSNDQNSNFYFSNQTVNYFIVSDGKGGPTMNYNTSNGFYIDNEKVLKIDGGLVKLYQNTSITICISQDNCYIGSNNTFFLYPKELVINVDQIPTRGGIVTINVKYFYNVYVVLKISIKTKDLNDIVLPIYGDSSTKRYFNISDEYSGVITGVGIISLNNNNIYIGSIKYIAPTINHVEENGNNLILHGDNFGKYVTPISVTIGSYSFSSTDLKMSVFNHSLLTMTLPDNYVPRSNDLILWVKSNSSPKFPITIVPIIQSITPTSYNGGNITISGYRLMVNESLSVKVGTLNCTSPTQIVYPRSFFCNLNNTMNYTLVNVSVWVAGVESDSFSSNIVRPDPSTSIPLETTTTTAPKKSYLKIILPVSIIGGVILLSLATFFIYRVLKRDKQAERSRKINHDNPSS